MRRAAYAGFIAVTVGSACGSGRSGAGEVGVYQDAGFSLHGDAGSGAIQVSVSPSAPSVCAGQCVTLTAQATGGSDLYSYTWSPSDGADGGTLQACPSASTTYQVTATDGVRSSESFASGAKAEAKATVQVSDACDGGQGDGARQDAAAVADGGPPAEQAHALCSIIWPWSPAPLSAVVLENSVVAADASNDILVAITYSGSITMPATGTTYQAAGVTDLLLVKMDTACKVLWTRDIGQVGTAVVAWAIASDSASRVVIAGDFNGTIDFGTGPLASNSTMENVGFVLTLDADGTPRWAQTIAGQNVLDMAADAKGDVAVSGYGSSFTGVTVLDPSGALLYRQDESTVLSSSGSSWYLGGNAAGEWVLAGGAGSAGSQAGAVALASSDGSTVWDVSLSVALPQPNLDDARAVLDTSGNAFLVGAWQVADDAGTSNALTAYLLAGVSATGTVRWSLSPSKWMQPPDAVSFQTWQHQLAVDGAGNAFLGGQLEQSAAFGALGTMTLTGTSDPAFVVADPAGHLRAAGHWGVAGLSENLTSMAVDRNDGVILSGSTPTMLGASSGTPSNFFVAKMGW